MESDEVEDLFLEYIKTLPIHDQKQIHSGYDFINSLTPDAEEDLKEEIWSRIKYNVNYTRLLDALANHLKYILPDSPSDDEDTEESESEE